MFEYIRFTTRTYIIQPLIVQIQVDIHCFQKRTEYRNVFSHFPFIAAYGQKLINLTTGTNRQIERDKKHIQRQKHTFHAAALRRNTARYHYNNVYQNGIQIYLLFSNLNNQRLHHHPHTKMIQNINAALAMAPAFKIYCENNLNAAIHRLC